MELTFTVKEQTCLGLIKQVFASNTVGYISASFDLDDNWKSMDTVTAIWKGSGQTIATALDSTYTTIVPPEVMTTTSPVTLNLVGSQLDGQELVERMTTFPVLALRVTAEALIDGDNSEITPSQYEQFVAQITEQINNLLAEIEGLETLVIGLKTQMLTLTDNGDGGITFEKGVEE